MERLGAHLGSRSRSLLERSARESESLVDKSGTVIAQFKSSVSRIGCANKAQLRANLKYEPKSDSALVLRRNAEKNPWRGVKRPEI